MTTTATDTWTVRNRAGRELARVEAPTYQEASDAAIKLPAVIASSNRERGLPSAASPPTNSDRDFVTVTITAIPKPGPTTGPAAAGWDIHKASCRDIGTDYRGVTYDDCKHFKADTKPEVTAECGTSVRYYPCTRSLRSN